MKTFDVRGVADELHICMTSAYRLLRSGELPAVKVGHLWRVSENSLERFLQGEHGPTVTTDTEKRVAA
jgi:excisionase family DNA binding protein